MLHSVSSETVIILLP